jgi:hypothetical protein
MCTSSSKGVEHAKTMCRKASWLDRNVWSIIVRPELSQSPKVPRSTAGCHLPHQTWNGCSGERSSNSGQKSWARHVLECCTGAGRAASARGIRPEGHVPRTDPIPGRLENHSQVPSTCTLRFCAAPCQAVQLTHAELLLTRQRCMYGIYRSDLKCIFFTTRHDRVVTPDVILAALQHLPHTQRPTGGVSYTKTVAQTVCA